MLIPVGGIVRPFRCISGVVFHIYGSLWNQGVGGKITSSLGVEVLYQLLTVAYKG